MSYLVQIRNDAIINRRPMQRFNEDSTGKQDKPQKPAKWPGTGKCRSGHAFTLSSHKEIPASNQPGPFQVCTDIHSQDHARHRPECDINPGLDGSPVPHIEKISAP
jgi:hypothetical protein